MSVGGTESTSQGSGSSCSDVSESCGTSSVSSDKTSEATVDSAMSDVSAAEVSAAAESLGGQVDGYEGSGVGAPEADPESDLEAQDVADLCIGTASECEQKAQEKAQEKADEMTDEEAIEALEGKTFHDPRSLTAEEVRGLEALSKSGTLSDRNQQQVDRFLEDHRNGVDSLGLDGEWGRGRYPTVFDGTI